MKPVKTLPSGVQILKTFTRFGMELELHYYAGHYSIHFSDNRLKTRKGNINHHITYNLAKFIYSKPKFQVTNMVMVINGGFRCHGIITDIRPRFDHGWNTYEYLIKEIDTPLSTQEWRCENQLI